MENHMIEGFLTFHSDLGLMCRKFVHATLNYVCFMLQLAALPCKIEMMKGHSKGIRGMFSCKYMEKPVLHAWSYLQVSHLPGSQ